VIVSDDPGALERADLPLPLPTDVPEWLSPLTAIVPGQVLGLRMAQARGLDVDRPAGLHKVTETR
jgi:glucosamine--fructose-6-phosphate aminotransferase (isomerizing)